MRTLEKFGHCGMIPTILTIFSGILAMRGPEFDVTSIASPLCTLTIGLTSQFNVKQIQHSLMKRNHYIT